MEKNISEILEEVKEAMCDDYCYYSATTADFDVLEKHCEDCPLNRL